MLKLFNVMLRICFAVAALLVMVRSSSSAQDLTWITVAEDGDGFRELISGRPFVPWGFNYDHDRHGRLIEDYWDSEWSVIESDFQEMKRLQANVVRIHLQFAQFMDSAIRPNRHALNQLARLVQLAEDIGLYLDLTGLGCYHRQDVPTWYDDLNEQDRWAAQAVFWEAVAETCAGSPAIFCYDLMNEPFVPGAVKPREDWLGPAFAGKHFVQFITLDTNGRPRHEIARRWIDDLVQAIRRHDRRHLVTVGLVPNSLDRPGLTSGFIPERVTASLDFVAMHIYPETGEPEKAIETVQGFAAVGKPVLIEELFPLRCGVEELEDFIEQSSPHADGWIGFYWGQTVEEYRPPTTKP